MRFPKAEHPNFATSSSLFGRSLPWLHFLITFLPSDLRRQARRLENELDIKLVSFSKLGSNISHSHSSSQSDDHTPLLGNTSSEHMIETMAMEIEQLIIKVIYYRALITTVKAV